MCPISPRDANRTIRPRRAETGGDQEQIPAERRRVMQSLQTDDHRNRHAGFCQSGKIRRNQQVPPTLQRDWSSDWPVGPRSRTDQSDRPVDPTIETCKRPVRGKRRGAVRSRRSLIRRYQCRVECGGRRLAR